MNRTTLTGALFAAATLLATGAYADVTPSTPATPATTKAADKADKTADKVEKKLDKTADKVGDKLSGDDKGKTVEDRTARQQKEHDAERARLQSTLKGPMDDATKQELRRHAERIARLHRIGAVAQQEKDTATADKVTALLSKENDRSDTWMAKHLAAAAVAPAAPGAVPVNAGDKGGAK